jgi:hypothetical protein
MVRKVREGIMLAMALCAALAAAGCKDADVKQVYEAEKLKKSGDHVRAVELFSEVASKPNLSEEAEQFIQINFCQHYGNPERANDPKVMTRKNMQAVARGCTDFFRNYPNRTSEGLGPFQTGALWSKLGEYEKAVEAFMLAEDKGFFDPKKTRVNQKEKENCVLLYKQIMEAGMKMPGEAGKQTMAMAVRGMQTKCHIEVGVEK